MGVFIFLETNSFIKVCGSRSYLFIVRFAWKEIWLTILMQYNVKNEISCNV